MNQHPDDQSNHDGHDDRDRQHPGAGNPGDGRETAAERGGQPVHGPTEPTGPRTSVRLRTASDVASAVPYILGYQPQDAVVILGLAGGRVQVGASLDIPDPADAPALAARVNEVLAQAPVREVLLVGYGAADVDEALTALAQRLVWPAREVLRVQSGRWWSLSCADPTCCPPGARILGNEAAMLALMVAAGAPASSRDALARDLQPAPQEVLDQVTHALHDDQAATSTTDIDQSFAALAAARTARREHRIPVPAPEAAVLLRALRNILVRDWCTIWADTAAANLWRDLLQVAPRGWVAPVATLLAVTVYQLGDGVVANLAVGRALDDDPDYSFALLVEEFLTRGLPPSELSESLRRAHQQLSMLRPSLPPAMP